LVGHSKCSKDEKISLVADYLWFILLVSCSKRNELGQGLKIHLHIQKKEARHTPLVILTHIILCLLGTVPDPAHFPIFSCDVTVFVPYNNPCQANNIHTHSVETIALKSGFPAQRHAAVVAMQPLLSVTVNTPRDSCPCTILPPHQGTACNR
jgi:hypothetical protein